MPGYQSRRVQPMQKKKRNRSRPTESFEMRLERYADNARATARRMPPGKERDALMKKAVQVDNVLAVTEWLATRNDQSSK
ncbi:hypothetical protein [Bradyrhizobium sp. STM 3562]|uniref:hypothetical protein n=1 Tax=Bradyrhizobium sp. STM 3562 TaxID=578924 RepID=UPI00389094B4